MKVIRCSECIYVSFVDMDNTTPPTCTKHNRYVEDIQKDYCIIKEGYFLQKYDINRYQNV